MPTVVGEHFLLRNPRDPVSLRYPCAAEFPGTFMWKHAQRRLDGVAVKITKVKLLTSVPNVVSASCGNHWVEKVPAAAGV